MRPAQRLDRIRVVPLTTGRWADFTNLFGASGACGGCWCMLWRVPSRDWDRVKGARNRKAMRSLVARGPAPGVLALSGRTVAGWCAVAPRNELIRLATSRAMRAIDDVPVWSISCLFVARPFRRRGVSVELLRGAAAFARSQGAGVVEGYPVTPTSTRMPDVFAWTGTVSAFRSAGFREAHRWLPDRPIMRLAL